MHRLTGGRRTDLASVSLETFMQVAENDCSEPTLPDAALHTNVWFSRGCQKRAKIKLSFTKGLCHKNFQCYR